MTLTEALATLHRAGRIERAWLAGMLATTDRDGSVRCVTAFDWSDDVPGDYEPDLTDPATVGCLLALLREASGDPRLSVVADAEGGDTWEVVKPDHEWGFLDAFPGNPCRGSTEGAAIAAALIALAEQA